MRIKARVPSESSGYHFSLAKSSRDGAKLSGYHMIEVSRRAVDCWRSISALPSLFPKDNRIYKASGLQLPPALSNHSIKKGVTTWVFLQAEIPTVLTSSQDVDCAVSNRELSVPQILSPWMSFGDGSYSREIVWMLNDTIDEDHHI